MSCCLHVIDYSQLLFHLHPQCFIMHYGFSVLGALPKSNGFKVALCDMLKHKSVKQLLDDHKHLKLLIH